jgi:ATP-binding cassette subfamily B protein
MFADSVRRAVLSAVYWPIMMALAGVGAALALWVGGRFATADRWTQGDFTIGTLVLFVSCAGMLIFPILEMARVLADLQTAQAAAERVLGLIDTEPDVKDSPDVIAAIEANRGRLPASGLALDGRPDRIGQIRFDKVCFSYKQDRQVLKDFDLTVEAGQTIALAGLTGGGKTTIVSLLCRFYEPTSGQILFDGMDYRQRSLEWLQSNLGIVLQEPHLFSGTIRENIRYGRLDASDEEVVEAARLVCAHDFITTLGDGYDTEVGEGGGKLSTGQKQLVSFARAVLADPRIFVMDEATSSVDTQTEQLIQQGLQEVLRGRISFIIAHRLSTIRSADVILVIDGGHIVEKGSHRELIGRRGRYYELYTNQFAQEKTSEILSQTDQ